MNKSIYGTYRGEFFAPQGEVYIGTKEDGQEFAQMSFLNMGRMHSDFNEIVSITDTAAELIMATTGANIPVSVILEDDQLKVHSEIKDVFSVDYSLEKISDSAEYLDEYVTVPEQNIDILKANNDYEDDDISVDFKYELGNKDVLKALDERGFERAEDDSFASIWKLYTKTCELYTQDGMGYVHSKEYGTIAQLLQAEKQGNYTNCRGISTIFAGVLRANGIKAFFEALICADPEDRDAHVVTEVYVSDFDKFVFFDPSTCLVMKLDGVYLNSVELKNALIQGRADDIEFEYCNDKKRPNKEADTGHLAYYSKNLCNFWRCIDNCETKDRTKDNLLFLSPVHSADTYKDESLVTTQVSKYFENNTIHS